MHDLQNQFATEAGEAAWTEELHALFGAGALDEAEALLSEHLSALDSELAWVCLELARDSVHLVGWDELAEAIALHEGDPVTGITIAIANEGDRDFEKGQVHHPYVLLGLYTDEAWAFSRKVHWEILDECHAEMPGWAGREEDVEIHMDVEGLDLLNTRLVHHKQRHFFRDSQTVAAPARYVEFVLGCWWRALRWHQAVAAECARCGLPGAVPVIAGMVDMRPEVVALYGASDNAASARPAARRASTMSESFGESFIQRKAVEEEKGPPTGSDIRRLARAEAEAGAEAAAPAPRTGFFARLFGRR